MSAPSRNTPAGRGSYVRGLHPVDVAAVGGNTEALTRALTCLPLGVRHRFPGPSNSVGRKTPTAFLCTLQCQPQHKGRRNRPYVPHRPVRLVLHLLSLLFPNMEQENRSECLESRHGIKGAFA